LEVIKHANSSPPGKKRLDKTKIYWAVMQSQSELNLEHIFGSANAEAISQKNNNIMPKPKRQIVASQNLGIIEDGYRLCTLPGCTWKVHYKARSTLKLKAHLEAEHKTLSVTCRAGCGKTFTTVGDIQAHEITKHPDSPALKRLRRVSLSEENVWSDHHRPNVELDSETPPAQDERDPMAADGNETPEVAIPESAAEVQQTSTGSGYRSLACIRPGCGWKSKPIKSALPSLIAHVKFEHKGQRFDRRATGCPKSFAWKNNRLKHEMTVHRIRADKL
jgi:hypothetical protein